IYHILLSFANAIKTAARPSQTQVQPHSKSSNLLVKFRAHLDIKEHDGKGNFEFVQRSDKAVFKLRKDMSKKISVTLHQIRGVPLNIKQCFGMFLAQGRNTRKNKLQLLDMEMMEKSDDGKYTIQSNWDPLGHYPKELAHLNEETAK
ncbi:unnamed protein product, partial [Didymodactylos carnosus]